MATRVNLLDNAPSIVFRGLNWAMAPLENPVGLDRPLWRDFSRYDLLVDLNVSQQNGVWGMANRCVMGWSGVDDTFQPRYSQAGDIGMFRTSYGVIYPSLDVVRFCDHWFKPSNHQDIDIIPRVLDAELQDGMSDAVVGEKIWHACEIIKSHDGVYPILYSRYMLLDKWLRYWTPEMINSLYYWGARYLWDRTREHAGPPYGSMQYVTIPEDRWVLHQTADKKAPFPGETERSTIVDWDRWELGNTGEMVAWINNTWGEAEPPPIPGDLEEQVALLFNRVGTIDQELITVNTKVDTNTGQLVYVDKALEYLDARVDDLEEIIKTDPPDPVDPPVFGEMIVIAKEKFPYGIAVGHNRACEKLADYEEGEIPGAIIFGHPPIGERIKVIVGQEIKVRRDAYYSCLDDPNDPFVMGDGNTPYYWVIDGYPGQSTFVRADLVYPK